MSKKKDKSPKTQLPFPKKVLKAHKEVCKFLKNQKKNGVEISIQFVLPSEPCGGVIHLSTMSISDTIGALEVARVCASSGLYSNQSFDSLVQSIEHRPDLVARLANALRKAEDSK